MPARIVAAPRRRSLPLVVAAIVVCSLAGCSSSSKSSSGTTTSTTAKTSTTAGSTTKAANLEPGYVSKEYDGTTHWLCNPALATDLCRTQAETVVDAHDQVSTRPAPAASDTPIDCFYVYPTTSDDPGDSADFNTDESEQATVRAQVGQYGSVCKVYAPAYRQITLAGLGRGFGSAKARALAYGDVLDAWRTYLSQDNHGRGVVLIGHSQGMSLLMALISQEIDPKPAVRAQVVSAILMGGSLHVPDGKLVGGDFKHIPGCQTKTELGCVVTFSSFPASMPPGTDAIFGSDGPAGSQSLCVNPVALTAGPDGQADTIIPRKAPLIARVSGTSSLPGTTPFIDLPGTLTAKC
ncbi:MAG TPA: DUF3089 domain-containing protein, partial [Acidimicrobiales bacterium]